MPRLAWMFLFAAPALAQDFETRYHEAFKLEVVDGKVADAAAKYLDLLEAKDLPAHLRAQSEFRFAVTCALLGRPDEARARLAALAAAPDVPAALKPQIEEYRKSLAEVEPGSAAAKRIEELVFQLGRQPAEKSTQPGVYRDFEIMGSAAVPHLRRLLDHTDQQLREHAFRILCRMNEPGLGAIWDPEWESTTYDLVRYFERRPEEIAAVERRLAERQPQAADMILKYGAGRPWSAAFLKAQAGRGQKPEHVVRAVVCRQDLEEMRPLLASWLIDGPDPLGDEAARRLASLLEWSTDKQLDSKLFGAVCRRLARGPNLEQGQGKGIHYAAALQPTGALLDLLAQLLDAKDAPTREVVAGVVAGALADRPTDEAEARRFAALLMEWMPGAPDKVVRACAERLPPAEAARLVGRWFAAGGESMNLVALERPGDVALLAAAIDAVGIDTRRTLLNTAFAGAWGDRSTSPETFLAMARMLPTLLEKIEARDLASWLRRLAPRRIPPEEAVALVVEIVRRVPSNKEACDALFREGWKGPDDGIYRRDIAVPALPRVWDLLGEEVRSRVAVSALRMLDESGPRAMDGKPRQDLAAFLLPRLDAMYGNEAHSGYAIVARHPDLFPLEAWLPESPDYVWDGRPPFDGAIERERLEQAVRALVADPSKVTDSMLGVLSRCVSEEVQLECATHLYRKADEKLLGRLLDWKLRPDPAVLEETFDRLSGADLAVVARLGLVLAEVRPSEKLYKLVERLLASPDRDFALQGIELARSLGRDALVQPLLGKLDSMDAEVRTKAREAIDSILELKRIKEEVATRLAGLR